MTTIFLFFAIIGTFFMNDTTITTVDWNIYNSPSLSYFFNILKTRDYSLAQLKYKAKQKNLDTNDTKQALDYLVSHNLINDQRLAQNLLEYYKGQKGKNYLQQKLLQKGISEQIIRSTVLEFEESLHPSYIDIITKNAITKTQKKITQGSSNSLYQYKMFVYNALASDGFVDINRLYQEFFSHAFRADQD
jgi:SOS response regulatory protein OraA/RecX